MKRIVSSLSYRFVRRLSGLAVSRTSGSRGLKTMLPQTPREDGPGAQDGEGEAEEAIFKVVKPGSINDEPG